MLSGVQIHFDGLSPTVLGGHPPRPREAHMARRAWYARVNRFRMARQPLGTMTLLPTTLFPSIA